MFLAGDSLLALSLYQYGLDRQLPIVAMDVERGKQYKWVAGQLEKEDLDIPTLSIQQLIALRGGKMLKSKRPIHSDQQIAAIKKLASSAISNPAHWYQVTQFFSLAKTNDLHAETEKILETMAGIITIQNPLFLYLWKQECFVLKAKTRNE